MTKTLTIGIKILENSGIAVPLFSYHAISSPAYAAETMSSFPSPSMSATNTLDGLFTEEAILVVVQPSSGVPSFTYHFIFEFLYLPFVQAKKISMLLNDIL